MKEPFIYSIEAGNALINDLNLDVRNQLKLLLETKHLYQRVTIDADRIIAEIRARVKKETALQQQFFNDLHQISNTRFTLTNIQLPNTPVSKGSKPILQLVLPNVKVFCDKCRCREAFSPLWFGDAAVPLTQPDPSAQFVQGLPSTFQLFSLVYQCQRCKGIPIAFQVRRDQWHLILEGRSPIEHIELPPFIPNAESSFFRDALIAMNTGKVLAALFYLRTFLERFARRQTGITEKKTGEEIMTAYSAGLPARIRDEMPSLREWYEKLSVALHDASEDAKLFEEAKAEIERHFDIRRVHKIPEKS